MKHAGLIIAVAVIGYVILQFMSPEEVRVFRKHVTKHGLRLLALLLVVAALLAAAVYLPASPLL